MTFYEIVVSVFAVHNGLYGLDGLLLAASRQPRSIFLTFVDVFLGLVHRSRGLRLGMCLICDGGFVFRHITRACDFRSVEFYLNNPDFYDRQIC